MAVYLGHGLAASAFAVAVTAACGLSRSPRLAAIVGAIAAVASFGPYVALAGGAGGAKLAACVLPSTCFALCIDVIALREDAGLATRTLSDGALDDGFSLTAGVAWMVASVLSCCIVAWVAESGALRRVLKPHCGRRGLPSVVASSVDAESGTRTVEPVDSALSALRSAGQCVAIRDVVVEFPRPGGGDFHAVDGVSLELFEGQITCLLGRNGAGACALLALHRSSATTNHPLPAAHSRFRQVDTYRSSDGTACSDSRARRVWALCHRIPGRSRKHRRRPSGQHPLARTNSHATPASLREAQGSPYERAPRSITCAG